MTKDKAYQNVVDALREYDRVSAQSEAAWEAAMNLRRYAHEAGEKLHQARMVLDDIMHRDAGIERPPSEIQKTA